MANRRFGWHSGALTCRDITVDNDFTVSGDLTFGDAVVDTFVIKGRMATGSVAGSALAIGSTYSYGEGIEYRWQVSDWTGVGSSFKGMYLRSEAATSSAAGKSVYGTEIYGVCNNVTMTTGSLWGTLTYAYVKGTGAVTVNNMYAGQFELTWDASRTADCTITTEAAILLAKITGGRVADYTKIHGMIIRLGEMDGDSQTFGNGIFIEDDAAMSGTSTLTKGICLEIGCTTGISIEGACTDGIVIAGACSDNGIEITGACTDSAIQVVTGGFATGLKLDADGTTGIDITSNFTGTTGITIAGTASGDGILISGACADGLHISGTNTTSAIHISGDQAIGILYDADAAATDGIKIAVDDGITLTTGINLDRTGTTGICTTAISIDVDGTTAIDIAAGFTGTTGINIAGTSTEAINITGNATTAINIDTGAFTSGLTMNAAFSGNALSVTNSAITAGDSYSGVRVAVTAATGHNNAYGIAAYFDSTLNGTQSNNVYNTGSWINLGSTYTVATNLLLVPFEGGIYVDGSATITNSWFLGLQLQMVSTAGAGAPGKAHWFRFNYNDGASGSLNAIFQAANPGSACFTAGAGTTSTKNGDIALADVVGTGVVYVRTYDAAG